MTVLEMFQRNVWFSNKYKHTETNKGSYFVEYYGDTLYLYLQGSNGHMDWVNNFDFAAEPYKDMSIKWKAHRGFVRVWKEIEPFVKDDIMNPNVKKINIVGYSHGAALAVLAHEYAWFNREDIRENIFGYGFEPPRVFHGVKIPKELEPRWENFITFRNGLDLVTYVPPYLWGYRHVGKMIHMNKDRSILVDSKYRIKCIDEHSYLNMVAVLEAEGFGDKTIQND